jgi:septum formation protein
LVAAHAAGKAEDVAVRVGIPDGGAVLGADTAVVIDGLTLGKPVDREDAVRMLRRLSGRTHTVLTAVSLLHSFGAERFVAATDVTFRELRDAHVEWYLQRGEWQGRAGGYAIQGAGAGFVARIDGDQTNVIGLPVAMLVDALERIGCAPWSVATTSPEVA